MNESFLEKHSKKCKELRKDKDIFDNGYRKKHNCRILCGKPYCNRLVDARNRYFKERSESMLLELVKFSKGEQKVTKK